MPPLVPSLVPFQVVALIWFASELWIAWRHRSDDPARTRDAGTLRLLLVTIYFSLACAVWMGVRGVMPFPPEARGPLFRIGLAMMIVGIAFRLWSVRVLARWFTIDVTIRPDHELVRSGPYRRLRHPSYTGSLATFYGCALCLGDVLALTAIVLPVTLAFLWRIRIEERVLAAAFGERYAAYARETWRLLPFVW